VSEPDLFKRLGLLVDRKQIPRIVVIVRNSREAMEPLELGVGAPSASWAAPAIGRIKTVSKPNPLELWDLPLSEEQTPHVVEKPKSRMNAMEPKETRCALHTQEVAGSSPVAPIIESNNLPTDNRKNLVA
jgi:hypothetical protein